MGKTNNESIERAASLHAQNRFKAAEEVTSEYVASKADEDGLLRLVNHQLARKDYRAASQTLGRLESVKASPETIHYVRGMLYSVLNDIPAAITELKLINESWHAMQIVHAELATLFVLRKDLIAAEIELDKARALGSNPQKIDYVESVLLSARGRYSESNMVLDGILAKYPDEFAAVNAKARNLMRMREFNQSKNLLEAVLSVRPDLVESWKLLGWTELKRKHYNGTEQAFKRVAELEPRDLDGYAGLRAVYIRTLRLRLLVSVCQQMAMQLEERQRTLRKL